MGHTPSRLSKATNKPTKQTNKPAGHSEAAANQPALPPKQQNHNQFSARALFGKAGKCRKEEPLTAPLICPAPWRKWQGTKP